MVSEKSDVILIFASVEVRCVFASGFFIFVFLQFEYDVPRCSVSLLNLLGVLLASWICHLVSVINLGKFPVIIPSNISSVSFSLSSPSGIPIKYMVHLL